MATLDFTCRNGGRLPEGSKRKKFSKKNFSFEISNLKFSEYLSDFFFFLDPSGSLPSFRHVKSEVAIVKEVIFCMATSDFTCRNGGRLPKGSKTKKISRDEISSKFQMLLSGENFFVLDPSGSLPPFRHVKSEVAIQILTFLTMATSDFTCRNGGREFVFFFLENCVYFLHVRFLGLP
jgi:hypothetical protein